MRGRQLNEFSVTNGPFTFRQYDSGMGSGCIDFALCLLCREMFGAAKGQFHKPLKTVYDIRKMSDYYSSENLEGDAKVLVDVMRRVSSGLDPCMAVCKPSVGKFFENLVRQKVKVGVIVFNLRFLSPFAQSSKDVSILHATT